MIQAGVPDVVDADPNNNTTSVTQTQIRDGVTFVLEVKQDPDSGAIERHWVPLVITGNTGGGDTTPLDTSDQYSFPCSVRGFSDGGLRVVGTTERWSSRGYIEHVDSVTMKFPPGVHLSERDRVTNVRDQKSGKILWTEENGKPTVFEVTGSVPIIDMFGGVIEQSALLNRAEVQSA